jgi:hypothetical protein
VRVERLILPEEAVAGAKILELATDDRLEGPADLALATLGSARPPMKKSTLSMLPYVV